MFFKREIDVAQNLMVNFFQTLTVRGHFHRKYFRWKKYGGAGLRPEKTEALYAELNKRAEAATNSYSATGNFLQYIYSVLIAKNHQKIRSRCLVHELSFLTMLITVTEQLHRRKNYLWLLPFYMAMATYCYYEKCSLNASGVIAISLHIEAASMTVIYLLFSFSFFSFFFT